MSRLGRSYPIQPIITRVSPINVVLAVSISVSPSLGPTVISLMCSAVSTFIISPGKSIAKLMTTIIIFLRPGQILPKTILKILSPNN